MPSRVDAVLGTFPTQLQTIKGKYERDLAEKEMSYDLLHDIARLIEDFQRAFDWTATDLDKQYGKGKDRSPYFPLLDHAGFRKAMHKDFPTVPSDVFTVIERHQPFQPGKAELAYLHDLTRVNKHQDFTPQTRTETHRVRASAGGGIVEWTPYQPGVGGVIFGGAPGQVLINGVPVDPRTQRPVPSATQVVTETVYVGWNFVKPSVPVLSTLESLAGLTTAAISEIRHEAAL